jgi:hypothetical protein
MTRATRVTVLTVAMLLTLTGSARWVAGDKAVVDAAPAPKSETIKTPTRAATDETPDKKAEEAAKKNALPHITIDRKKKTVTVDGFIAPRMETLELFACGNGVREHEAIVSVKARPRDINVAMILLGTAPGHGALWTKDGKFLPPYGPVFRVFVEHVDNGRPKRVEAHEMLKDATTGKVVKPMTWVFAGGASRKGHFIPDYEGTVVCLSNFEAPILDVPFASSAKNTELLYVANEKMIPKVGTPVKLILQATGKTVEGKKLVWPLVIEQDGSLKLDGKVVTLKQLDEKLKNRDQYVQKVQIFGHRKAPLGMMLDAMGVITRHPLEVETLPYLGGEDAKPKPVDGAEKNPEGESK